MLRVKQKQGRAPLLTVRHWVVEKQTSSGFTLIEVIMVLAISAALAVALLGGFSSTQRRARFTDAIERTVAVLDRVKTEVNSSYTTGEGENKDRIFFAKALVFSTGSSSIEIHTITANNADIISGLQFQDISKTASELPWGTTLTSSVNGNAVVFSRNPADGLLNTYVMPSSSLISPSDYSASTGSAEIELNFTDGSGSYQATVRVKASSGEITTEYIN